MRCVSAQVAQIVSSLCRHQHLSGQAGTLSENIQDARRMLVRAFDAWYDAEGAFLSEVCATFSHYSTVHCTQRTVTALSARLGQYGIVCIVTVVLERVGAQCHGCHLCV
jgi:hypothetical protein